MARLSLTDAAEAVLRRHSKGAPLHYRRIAELAIAAGYIVPRGATPKASLNAAVTQEIKRREATGKEQRFTAHGRGMYSLTSPSDPLGGAIEKKNAEVRARLRTLLSDLNPRLFESLVGELLVALGFEDVEVTKYSGDGGIDLRATLAVGGVTDVRTAIQVKRWAGNVGGRIVRELRGELGPQERGLIITLSDFTRDARIEASASDRSPISLLSGERLLDLLIQHEIGVRQRQVTMLELDEEAFSTTVEETPEEAEGLTAKPLISSPPPLKTAKALSMWPLPGGRLAWKVSLDHMLTYAAEKAPTMPEAVKWLMESFEKVKSEKVARGYWQVLRSFGLIETRGEQVVATSAGADYLSNATPAYLLQLAEENVAGFTEMLGCLRESPRTSARLLADLKRALGFAWESDAQIRFRLGWLENLGVVEVVGEKWKLTSEDGRQA